MGAGRRAIDIQSFRATYGWLGIDITGRLLEHATKLPDSLVAENVDLPVGDLGDSCDRQHAGKAASKHFNSQSPRTASDGIDCKIHRADR